MPSRIVNVEQETRRRELRLRIGRLRRLIDRRVRNTQREARRLVSWRTYVRSYPGHAVLAALGLGLALSAGLSGRRLSRWLGWRMIRRAVSSAASSAVDRVGHHFWTDLAKIRADSTRTGAAEEAGDREAAAGETTGVDDERA